MVKTKAVPCFCNKIPALAGIFCLLLIITGCKTGETPEEVTTAFWHALAVNDLETARKYATKDSQALVNSHSDLPLDKAALTTGEAEINGDNASVEVQVEYELFGRNQQMQFNTFLSKEDDLWKVDYQQTLAGMPAPLLGSLFQFMRNFSEQFNQQLEQQLPLIEQFFESFGQEIYKQMEEFNREFQKPFPQKREDPYEGTI